MLVGVAPLPPSLIPTLWNIGILLHKQAELPKLLQHSVLPTTYGPQKFSKIRVLKVNYFHLLSKKIPQIEIISKTLIFENSEAPTNPILKIQ